MPIPDCNPTAPILREEAQEPLFVVERLRYPSWRGTWASAVLHPGVDRSAYDVVVECGEVLRHMQVTPVRLGCSSGSRMPCKNTASGAAANRVGATAAVAMERVQ